MLKSDLIDQLMTKHAELPKEDVAAAVRAIFEKMAKHLAQDGRIEIRGFGSFALSFRASRIARNPKTGKSVAAPARYAIRFKPGLELSQLVNQKNRSK